MHVSSDPTTWIVAGVEIAAVAVAYLSLRRQARKDREDRNSERQAREAERQREAELIKEQVLGRAAVEGLGALPALSVQLMQVRRELAKDVDVLGERQRHALGTLSQLGRDFDSHRLEDHRVQDAMRRDIDAILRTLRDQRGEP